MYMTRKFSFIFSATCHLVLLSPCLRKDWRLLISHWPGFPHTQMDRRQKTQPQFWTPVWRSFRPSSSSCQPNPVWTNWSRTLLQRAASGTSSTARFRSSCVDWHSTSQRSPLSTGTAIYKHIPNFTLIDHYTQAFLLCYLCITLCFECANVEFCYMFLRFKE